MATITTRLSGLFKKMKPGQPVRVEVGDATDRNARSLEQMVDEPSPSNGKKGLLSRLPGSKRDAAISHLHEGFTEVVDLVHDVRGHLRDQADRSERLLTLMSPLPDALETLPETSRNQARMVEAMNTHLDKTDRQADSLNHALTGLAKANEHQGQVLGLIQQQIESSRQTDQQMLHSFSAMNETLQQLSVSNHASAKSLAAVTEQSRTANGRMDDLIRRNSRQMLVMTAANWVLAAAALGLAVFAVLAV